MNVDNINEYIQRRLKQEGLTSIPAVTAAQWLEQEGLLQDSKGRKGKQLRELLRKNLIASSWQDANKRWHIDRME